jgi:hypothetical protein
MKPLSAHTIKRARWLRDLCKECPHDASLTSMLTKNDCEALAEALDFAVRASARLWKPVKAKKL